MTGDRPHTKGPREHSPYFFIRAAELNGAQVSLHGDDARHIVQVRRARPGDVITVSDGAGRIARLELESVSEKSVLGRKLQEATVDRPKAKVSIFQGLAKGAKVDTVVQKLVEMGVDEVAIFDSSRSVPKWDEGKKKKAHERWLSIGLEAAKQSRRAYLPQINGPLSFDEAASLLRNVGRKGLVLVAHESAGVGLRSALADSSSENYALVVGPEGGFNEQEAEALALDGKTVNLGSQILRTETASLVAAAILLYELGRIG